MNSIMTQLSTLKTAFIRRLRDERGDSLAEALVALLIAVLGATLLATMVVASMNVASSTTSALATTYDEQSAMTQAAGPHEATIQMMAAGSLLNTSVDVHVYASADQTFLRYENAASSQGDTP